MWGLSIFNVFSKYSKEHQKLLKLAHDIIEFVKIDHEKEQLQKRLQEPPKITTLSIYEEVPKPKKLIGNNSIADDYDGIDEDGFLVESKATEFWEVHTLDPTLMEI